LTKLLIKHIKRKPPEAQREAYGILSGITGIICNLLLCAVKFILGYITGAVSVTADAVNNLSDAAVNIVTIAGTKLAGKPVDKEHPFGHGRAEYISALVVALSVFLMSFELAKSSVMKIIHPEKIKFSAVYIVILCIAICVKLWMAHFNRKLYIITDNLNLKAVMKDSLNDCIATLATATVILLSGLLHIQRLDGIIGCAVAVFVFLSGVGVIKDILGPLLGQPPSDELVNEIEDIILSNDLIWGVHDLIIHNYGPGRIIASAHAEVPCEADLMTVHEVIDSAE
jgi:cation diffusion facilitator family transporter